MRFRYETKLVSPAFLEDRRSALNERCVIVFAAAQSENGVADSKDFEFLPLRECRILRIKATSGFVFLDLLLLEFVRYEMGSYRLWDDTIKRHPARPHPESAAEHQGHFVYRSKPLPDLLIGDTHVNASLVSAWQSVVKEVNKRLPHCVTFRVLGFYKLNSEQRVVPANPTVPAVYHFDSGETVDMRLLFFRETSLEVKRRLSIEFDHRLAISSLSRSTINVPSRYNQESILLSCTRTAENVLGPLSFHQTDDESEASGDSWVAQPLFVIQVGPARFVLPLTLLLLVTSFYLGSLDSLQCASAFCRWSAAPLVCGFVKPTASVMFLVATWLYLRKMPLNKA